MENNSKKGVRKILARILVEVTLISTLAIVVLAVPCSPTDIEPTDQFVIVETETVVEETETILEETIILNDIAVTYPNLVYEDFGYKDGAIDYYDALEFYIMDVEAAIASGTFTDVAVVAMQNELDRLNDVAELYQEDIERFTVYEEEHYYAAQVWQTLRLNGFSDAAAAGILGNMMWETAGGTLDLKPEAYSYDGGFYGICQWSLYYNSHIENTTFEEQLEYLLSNIGVEFESFGCCYDYGFTLEDFKSMEDPAKAATAFADVYERCSSGSYGLRKSAARDALEYFTSKALDE